MKICEGFYYEFYFIEYTMEFELYYVSLDTDIPTTYLMLMLFEVKAESCFVS